ncbi:MAG: hypothetical protein R3C01_04465 [Planctomycetaceae bacterium]
MENRGNQHASDIVIDLDGCIVEIALPDIELLGGVILLHDRADVSNSVRHQFRQPLHDAGLAMISMSGAAGWWLDVVTPGFHPTLSPVRFVLETLLACVEEKTALTPPRIALLGIGSGGQGGVGIAYRNARRFPVMAVIGPDVDFHQWYGHGSLIDQVYSSREAARQQTATLHLHPLNWPMHQLILCDPADPIAFEGTERLLSKLRSTGIPVDSDLKTTTGGNMPQYIEQAIPRVVEFLKVSLSRIGTPAI